jgi:short subunit dehydrogenase-like uncharacterized protein
MARSHARSPQRPYDIVLFGATGFTGALTAEYLAAHAPSGTQWALAGRNQGKLEALRGRLGVEADILHADVTELGSMRRLAEAARVVITTVGPYIRYGEPVLAACVQAGTDYVDLTGESEFVDRMYVRYHAQAEQTGARLVHACGFESIPPDLGALFTVQQLPEGVPIRLRGFVSASLGLSGGTLNTAMTVFSRLGHAKAAHAERRRAQPCSGDRRVRTVPGRPGYERAIGAWVVPSSTIDPQIVTHSARALDRFGPDFSYSHYLAAGNPALAAALGAVTAGAAVLAHLPPARMMVRRLRPSGSGPSAEQRKKSWFRVHFVGEGAGHRVITQIAGGDPGYGETSKMLAESALCLAGDDLPVTAGQVTTAVAMGDALRERLQRAGITFRVLHTT